MKIRILAASRLALALGTAAFAENPGKGMPETWKGAIGDAFYSDATTMTLRPQDEVKTRWSLLSAEQQAQVRADCKNLAMNTERDYRQHFGQAQNRRRVRAYRGRRHGHALRLGRTRCSCQFRRQFD